MNHPVWIRALVSALIGLFFSLIFTYLVSLMVPNSNLTWSLIAVGFASLFSGFAGYMSGAKHGS